MQRFILILMGLLCFTSPIHSQDLEYGAKVGFTHQNFGDVFGNWSRFSKKFNKDFGFDLGFYGRAQFTSFYVQPEVMFHRTNKQIEIDNGDQNFEISYSRLSIPVLVGQKYLKIFRVNIGPVGTIQIAGKSDDTDNVNYNDFNIGSQVGFGIDVWKIRLDAKYQIAFNELTSGPVQINGREFNATSYGNFFLLELGYQLGD